MPELSRLIGEATAALSVLDAGALERLGRKVQALAAANEGTAVSSRAEVPELEARFRVFAQVLTATGENMAALERARARGTYTARMRAGLGGESSETFQSEAEEGYTPWPQGRMARHAH